MSILLSPAVTVSLKWNAASWPATRSVDQFALARNGFHRGVEAADRLTADVHLAADRILDGGVVGVQLDEIVRGALG